MPSISQKELDELLKAKEKIEKRKAYMKAYNQTPERKANMKAYRKAYYQNVIKPAIKAFCEARKSKEK